MNTTTTATQVLTPDVLRGASAFVAASAVARSWHSHTFVVNAATVGTGMKPAYKGITRRPPEGSS